MPPLALFTEYYYAIRKPEDSQAVKFQYFSYNVAMEFIKNLIPEAVLKFIRPVYHGLVALMASVYFGRPSEKMVVIGVTGTTGKSTTIAMLGQILNFLGKKTGYITTVKFFNGNQDFLNKHGLSMPGGWLLQKQLKQIKDNGCNYAIVECTSEGLAQNRHLGINFDVVLFTNLSHAHLEAHGSFGNYRQAKGRLFDGLYKGKKKSFFPQKIIGVNCDDPMSGYFLSFEADKKFGVSFNRVQTRDAQKVFFAKALQTSTPMQLDLDGTIFTLNLLGVFNLKNASLAVAAAESLGVDLATSAKALNDFRGVRGRMEKVANVLGFQVIVDYGCEPASIQAALEESTQLGHNRLIHVFGSTGGHRDVAKRFAFGKISAQYADKIVVTNDDVYDSNPEEIAKNIEQGIQSFKLRKPEYQIVLDRREAIAKALSIAKKDDIVLITGKGSEQFLVLPGNKRIEWDDVMVVKEEIGKLAERN